MRDCAGQVSNRGKWVMDCRAKVSLPEKNQLAPIWLETGTYTRGQI